MKKIQLTQGKFALVDDEDYELLNQFKWYATKAGDIFYAVKRDGYKHISMHRFLLKLSKNQLTDHKNRNGLDNQQCNLRICTVSQNGMNRRPNKTHITSQYKGVYWRSARKRWISHIKLNGYNYWLGSFNNEIEAAKTYDYKARELFGEFAHLNFSVKEGKPKY